MLSAKYCPFCPVFNVLTHWGLVTPYGDRDLGQHWLRWWLVAWPHQAITWTIVDLSSVRVIHLRASSQEIPQPSITEIIWKMNSFKFPRGQWVKQYYKDKSIHLFILRLAKCAVRAVSPSLALLAPMTCVHQEVSVTTVVWPWPCAQGSWGSCASVAVTFDLSWQSSRSPRWWWLPPSKKRGTISPRLSARISTRGRNKQRWVPDECLAFLLSTLTSSGCSAELKIRGISTS